jgi:hypothetical protein
MVELTLPGSGDAEDHSVGSSTGHVRTHLRTWAGMVLRGTFERLGHDTCLSKYLRSLQYFLMLVLDVD